MKLFKLGLLLGLASGMLVVNAAVFQFQLSVLDKKERPRAVFLWLPAESNSIRGLLVSGQTLIEKSMSTDPEVRRLCAENDLGILFSTIGLSQVDIAAVTAEAAKLSGYKELATVPMFFVGHSAGGPQALAKAIAHQDRCFGLMQYRGGVPVELPAHIPSLTMVGQFDEFGGVMRDAEGREHAWEGSKDALIAMRAADPTRMLSFAVEPGAGHFAWSDRNAKLFSLYLGKAAERIGKEPQASTGVLTPLELRTVAEPISVTPNAEQAGKMAWHMDREMAKAINAYHAPLFGRKDQFIRWKNRTWVDAGTRYYFMGLDMVGEGDSFTVAPVYAETVLEQQKGNGPIWTKAGEPVGNSGVPIKLKVIGGPVVVSGDNTLQLALSNVDPIARKYRIRFMAYSEGNEEFRYTEQVGMAPRNWKGNSKGNVQTLSLAEIPDMVPTAAPHPLEMTSDSGLKPKAYVAYGPAQIVDGTIVLAEIPRNAVFPIECKVVVYQMGSGIKGKLVQQAVPVERSFKINKE